MPRKNKYMYRKKGNSNREINYPAKKKYASISR